MKLVEKKDFVSVFTDIKEIVEQSRIRIAININAEITSVYWKIGERIRTELLKEQRAEYGKKIINQLAVNLTQTFGSGWSEKQLRHCLRFAETFPDETIVSALWRQLSWSHLENTNWN
jgi:hypothetical protein